MSLVVYPYIRQPSTGEIHPFEEDVRPPYNDLFGLEIWRNTVWGSEVVKELGCDLIYSLKHDDIYAEKGDLKKLAEELKVIKSRLKMISRKVKVAEETLLFRINNALEAVRLASEHEHGGVCIG